MKYRLFKDWILVGFRCITNPPIFRKTNIYHVSQFYRSPRGFFWFELAWLIAVVSWRLGRGHVVWAGLPHVRQVVFSRAGVGVSAADGASLPSVAFSSPVG